MFDPHLNGHHRLSFYVHGPEWAFVIPADDRQALLDVVKVCSRSWNGAGALVLLAGEDGRLLGDWERLVGTRSLDTTWLHPSLAVRARERLAADDAIAAQDWGSGIGFDALHPVELLAPPGTLGERRQMIAPAFDSAVVQNMADVSWGIVERPSDWAGRFDVGVGKGGLGFPAMLGGQLGLNMVSPLRAGQISMDVFGQWDPQPWPYLWIFENDSVEELVAFWNLRSGASTSNRFASVVGLPRDALAQPSLLDSLNTWVRASSGAPLSPTVLAKVTPEVEPELEAVLPMLGVERLPSGEEPRRLRSSPANESLTWLPWRSLPNGRILRGAWDDVEYAVHDGRALITLPSPRGYRSHRGARIVLQTLPTPLPITPAAARRMSIGAAAHPQGLSINMGSGSPWAIDLLLPNERDALQNWASDHGYVIEEPPAGKDARALLQRLGDLDRLDCLVDELGLEVLTALAPLARDRLVRKLAKEIAAPVDRGALADELMQKLRAEGLLLELDGRTIEQLESALARVKRRFAFDRHALIEAVSVLVRLGFVQRGRNVECPRCRFGAFLALSELDEDIRCRGCGFAYLLPVDARGGEEARTAYRLDGLMARVMERHVLPVVLTLRALRDPARMWRPNHIWPGMLFRRPGEGEIDIDLLASDGTNVFATECKLDARGLQMPQLEKLLAFAERVRAIPMVAALNGDFAPQVREAVESLGGLVLVRGDLIKLRRT